MKELTLFILMGFAFFTAFGQDPKSVAQIGNLNDSYKRTYFNTASNEIDTLSGLQTFVVSGYIRLQDLPAASPIFKMISYFKYQILPLDSADLSRGHAFNVYPIKFSDSIFFRNTYFYKEGQILKIKNFISVPHLTNEALIYYSDGKPFKIFWATTKNPYLMILDFYYFDGKNISDRGRSDFKSYAPFEYQRALDLFEDFKKQILE